MNKKLFILGASGHGKVVADIALAQQCWQEIVFYDDAFPAKTSVGSFNIAGDSQALLSDYADNAVVIGIGNNEIRQQKHEFLEANDIPVATLIHPSAIISPSASIGPGSVVMPGAIVNADSHIGKSCIINTGAIVEHDCVVSDYAHLSPNACIGGQVTIGKGSWIGLGGSVKNQISIGDYTTVGVGAAVVKNIGSNETVVGVPAKPVKC